MIDVAVVGGGPVGLMTALYAGRAGLDVRVYEPRAGCIDKACGEGLMPGALSELRSVGLDPPGHALRGIRYLAGDRTADAEFGSGPGRGVRRTMLHTGLAAAVADLGVPVVHRAVRGVATDAAGVSVEGLRCRYVVGADGLHSPLRRSLDLQGRQRVGRRFGLRAHVQTMPWTDFVEVHWAEHAEAYVTPVAPDCVNIALLSATRAAFRDQLDAFPVLRDRIGADELSQVRGAGPLRQTARARVAGRVLLVGDASGYVDALTGEGMAVGFAQARAVVEAILADDPRRYERAWRRITWRHRLITEALLTASRRQMFRRRLVPAASRFPRVFTAAVDQLARPA